MMPYSKVMDYYTCPRALVFVTCAKESMPGEGMYMCNNHNNVIIILITTVIMIIIQPNMQQVFLIAHTFCLHSNNYQ